MSTFLEEEGITLFEGYKASNIPPDADVIVIGNAMSRGNEEVEAVLQRRLRYLSLPETMKEYFLRGKRNYVVTGTHGKTTTTSMISHILLAGNCDPTILVGGMLPSIGGNLRIGHSENFVNESCEYTNSFLSFFPTTAVILNIAEDHLDFFKDINDIRHSFKRFMQLVPKDGYVILNSDIDDTDYFTRDLDCHIITFGKDPAKSDYSAADITYNERGCCHYTLWKNNVPLGEISLSVPGIHNVYNSLAAIAVGLNMNLSLDVIRQGLLSYTGTDRRFQYKGSVNGITIIDDYAHHPDEITATLKAARNYPHRETWVIFQPHTYSRTKLLYDQFVEALSHADHVILADIYAARETDTLGVSSELLAQSIRERGTDAYYLPDFKSIEDFVLKKCMHDDLLITMGAGNVVTIGEELLEK